MFRNYLAAALRHFARSRLFSAINIVGLAVGFCVPMIVATYVHHELSYERFLPSYERIMAISGVFAPRGAPSLIADSTTPDVGRWLREKHPSLGTTVRISAGRNRGLMADNVEIRESVAWADPEFFDVFQVPAVAGDLQNALRSPDNVVLTRAAAQRLFGRADPIGKTIRVERRVPLRVAAIIEDLPSNTHLAFELVASNRNELSPYLEFDSTPYADFKSWEAHTYVLLAPGITRAQLEAGIAGYQAARRAERSSDAPARGNSFPVTPIAQIHLSPPSMASMGNRGSKSLLFSLGVTATLILLIASSNFVNLATARASRRAVEVGVRKAAGATQSNLIVQFIGESVLHAAIAALLALVMTEWLIPLFNALTFSEIEPHYPTLVATLVALTLLVGVIAGSYPAFVLARFRPAVVLKGGRTRPSGGLVRQVLVLLQFATLIGLLSAIVVIFQQTRLAMELSARLDTHGVLAIGDGCGRPSFVEAVRSLSGVASAACSQGEPFNWVRAQSFGEVRPGVQISIASSAVDFGFFELYGIEPLAGRLFSREHASDAYAPSSEAASQGQAPAAVIVNETGSRRMGFASPQQAVGQFLDLRRNGTRTEIVGVVPDFLIDALSNPIEATVYEVRLDRMQLLSIRLRPGDEARTLRAIDAAWAKHGKPQPSGRFEVEQEREYLYAELASQGQVFGIAAAIAATLACLGMFGLAAFMAERRTREVGIRKAMGAERSDILRLLMWHLTRPVLLANLLAWPVAYFVMRRWLDGFAYRVELEWWTFAAASGAALLIAWVTVLAQALRVARAKPVTALRYE